MINIPVDEGYAFDYLTILELKAKLLGKCEDLFEYTLSRIIMELGPAIVDRIIQSKEYQALFDANYQTFKIVERLKRDETVTAREVDNLNALRFQRKAELQNKFFGTKLLEFKTYHENPPLRSEPRSQAAPE